MMEDVLGTENNFKSLSIKDLLEARDLYHYHLMNKPNVVGTAIGLYFIRLSDPSPEDEKPPITDKTAALAARKSKSVRTLENSGIRSYSWPCVHAFVSKWVDEDRFGSASGQLHPEAMVPKTLYLPDGRMVPVCVTQVEQAEAPVVAPIWQWPGGVFGGGMPIVIRTQERELYATAGGLVTDGHKIYALTSRHVSGDDGEPIYTFARGIRTRIGRGSNLHISRLPFADVYPEFPGRRTFVKLDVGLIELDDAAAWTSMYFDLGEVEALADLNELNISVRLIDAPVVAVGAASGRLEGRIKALFYRFKSVSGYDYVADFLIAPRLGGRRAKSTLPGDSGAVWHLSTRTTGDKPDNEDEEFRGTYRPLAVEWGGQVFLSSDSPTQPAFALATSLTTVSQALDVELVLKHNVGALPYWGQVGHYTIGASACEAVADDVLKTFVKDNISNISFTVDDLSPATIKERLRSAGDDGQLIPLADVPDLVWKKYVKQVGGRDTRYLGKGRTTGPEHPTHYADIDQPLGGKTLRSLCVNDDKNIDVDVWRKFYDDLGQTEEKSRGLLPFRVWQFFDAMVDFASGGAADKFLCAAGLLSHYVGDACQPLHGSMYADGYADQPKTVTHHRKGTDEEYTEDSHVGAGVHSTYETKMVDRYSTDIVEGVRNGVSRSKALAAIRSGKEAAKAIIGLMDRTAKRLPPKAIVDAYIDAGDSATAAARDELWNKFGAQTIATMVDGARVLAAVWTGAWATGRGQKITKKRLVEIDPAVLKGYYEDKTFVESLNLDNVGSVLR